MTVDQPLTVDLYVRADAPVPERRDEVIDRLQYLSTHDRIAGFDVASWPRAVSLGLADRIADDGVPRTVRSFERWANRHGLRIRPLFDVRRFRSTITGETDDLLVPPVLCLAARNEEGLAWIAPVHDGASTVTVEDALDALAAGRPPIPGLSVPWEDGPPQADESGSDTGRAEAASEDAEPDTIVDLPR
jgi:hypothetical protein